MTRASAYYQKQLDALQATYLKQLPQKVKAIEDALDRLVKDGWDQEGLESLCLLVHRLAGSAGIYHVDGVSSAADRLEAVLRAILDGADPATAARDRLATLVGDLGKACAAIGLRSHRRSS